MINCFFKLIAASRGFACYLHVLLVSIFLDDESALLLTDDIDERISVTIRRFKSVLLHGY